MADARPISGPTSMFDPANELLEQLLSVAQRVVGRHDAEDVVQDVLLRHLDWPSRFDAERGSLSTYLGMVTRHHAIDRIRSERARRAREEGTAPAEPVATSVEVDALRSVSGSGVVAALRLMPAEEREPIVLAYWGNLTYSEVAARLQIPEGTAKTRIRRGVTRLRELLESAAEG